MSGTLVNRLEKRFDALTTADQLSFEVDEDDVLGMLGPNGPGKTTTVRMLACLISPTRGSACVGGFAVTRKPSGIASCCGRATIIDFLAGVF